MTLAFDELQGQQGVLEVDEAEEDTHVVTRPTSIRGMRPVGKDGNGRVTAVACGWLHAMAITANGSLHTFGWGSAGLLGHSSSGMDGGFAWRGLGEVGRVTAFRSEKVLAASGYPDAAYGWILAVETKTIEQLEDCEGFDTMDAQLLQRIMSCTQGNLKNKLELAKEKRKIDAVRKGEPDKARIRGRVLTKMVLDSFEVDAHEMKQMQMDKFRAIKLKGDNVRLYWHDWDYVLGSIKAEYQPDEYEQ